MPSQTRADSAARPSEAICVYGDSHIASVKRAQDRGLLDTGGRALAFWGANGPKFRGLRWKQGRIVPDPDALDVVKLVSGGRETLAPGDFGLFIFYAGRLRPHEFFKAVADHEASAEGYLTEAQLTALARGWTDTVRAWRFARLFARNGARVVFVPNSFPTKGIARPGFERDNLAMRCTKTRRAQLWALLQAEAGRAGFDLVPQPEETVTPDGLTKAEFAAPNAAERRDRDHKSAEYAALMMARALACAGVTAGTERAVAE